MLSPANSRVLPKESRPEPNNSDHPPILPDRRHADEIRSSPRDTEPPSAEIRILSRASTVLLMGLSRKTGANVRNGFISPSTKWIDGYRKGCKNGLHTKIGL
ncbi:hypothetical protein CDAR_486801 [Caerostris darwini]|uniref:Uncharacterized protein n=1 Tax=Caerostris darwini TaxID=1538125 RepID=A0AAV4NZP5_9ARAC|nr:hypothetical protein CDAR_486801 [Caerostris darwini]